MLKVRPILAEMAYRLARSRPPAEHFPLLAVWEITDACNLACAYCGSHPDCVHSVSPIERGLSAVLERPPRLLILHGGEPTLVPDLPGILAHIKASSSRIQIILETNLTLPKIVGECLPYLWQVIYGLDGIKGVNKKLRGIPAEAICERIISLHPQARALGVREAVFGVITKENYTFRCLSEMIEYLRGFIPDLIFGFQIMHPGNHPLSIFSDPLKFAQAQANFLRLQTLYGNIKLWGHNVMPGAKEVICPCQWFFRLISKEGENLYCGPELLRRHILGGGKWGRSRLRRFLHLVRDFGTVLNYLLHPERPLECEGGCDWTDQIPPFWDSTAELTVPIPTIWQGFLGESDAKRLGNFVRRVINPKFDAKVLIPMVVNSNTPRRGLAPKTPEISASYSTKEKHLYRLQKNLAALDVSPYCGKEHLNLPHFPVFTKEGGKGAYVTDIEGERFLDYIMAYGPVILGYNYPAVTEAVRSAMERGPLTTLMDVQVLELAELLNRLIPCAEQVRFGKNGSDVCEAAIRLARAVTGRQRVAYCGFHGFHDWFAASIKDVRGIPVSLSDLLSPFEFNNLSSLERLFEMYPGEIAAVLLEPCTVLIPSYDFLQKVKALTAREGAVLIFDEIVTGFRLALGGAQELFGVTPDLACFGKSIANGYPLSALCGKRALMSQLRDCFYSLTYEFETASIAAALATLEVLEEESVTEVLWRRGGELQDTFNRLALQKGIPAALIGPAPRLTFHFPARNGLSETTIRSRFLRLLISRHILSNGSLLPSFSHGQREITYTCEAFDAALDALPALLKQEVDI